MLTLNLLLLTTTTLSLANAYTNNCQGSLFSPSASNCAIGLSSINTNTVYSDGAQFSSGNCFIAYRTDGHGPNPVSGQLIRDTAQAILNQCSRRRGSYGTNNCEACHVTINYRAPKVDG